jgi:hypothetical protein
MNFELARLTNRSTPQTDFGTLFHLGIRTLAKRPLDDPAAIIAEITESYQLARFPRELRATVRLVEALFPIYAQWAAPLPWLAWERHFAADYTHPSLPRPATLHGHVDALYATPGGPGIFESKTAPECRRRAAQSAQAQVLFYAVALRRLGESPVEAVVNLIRRPSMKADPSRLRLHAVSNPGWYFQRWVAAITDDVIDAFEARVLLPGLGTISLSRPVSIRAVYSTRRPCECDLDWQLV